MRLTALFLLAFALPAAADTAADNAAEAQQYGTLNPEELSINRVLKDIEDGKTTMTNCATGYFITKSGDHANARKVFTRCAADGYSGAMTWMGQMDDNGLGAPENPAAAAEWDRQAAETGDPVGQFNLGLDLLRGRGVARDEAAGRALIDQAAGQGLSMARRLQGADYDTDEVTPDADNWKYGERLF